MNSFPMIIVLVLMVLVFYFLMIRPQRKRQQQQQSMLKTLEPGKRVMTSTGIYGTVVASGDRQLVLETSPGSRITVLKQAIARSVTEDDEDAELRSYQPDTPQVPDDLSGLTDASGNEAYGSNQGFGTDPSASGDDDSTPSGATGMAGGAPIQEYTPGGQSGNFQDPEHNTAPWPSAGYTPGASDDPEVGGRRADNQDQFDTSATDTGGSVLGGSSLSSSSWDTTNGYNDESQREGN